VYLVLGVIRDHSRLEPGGLGSPVECASCGSYDEVRVIALFRVILLECW